MGKFGIVPHSEINNWPTKIPLNIFIIISILELPQKTYKY